MQETQAPLNFIHSLVGFLKDDILLIKIGSLVAALTLFYRLVDFTLKRIDRSNDKASLAVKELWVKQYLIVICSTPFRNFVISWANIFDSLHNKTLSDKDFESHVYRLQDERYKIESRLSFIIPISHHTAHQLISLLDSIQDTVISTLLNHLSRPQHNNELPLHTARIHLFKALTDASQIFIKLSRSNELKVALGLKTLYLKPLLYILCLPFISLHIAFRKFASYNHNRYT